MIILPSMSTTIVPMPSTRYRARFYFDPNSIPMASGDAHIIFKGFAGASTEVLQMEFRLLSVGVYQIRASIANDAASFTNTSFFTISDAPHFIEIDWRAATAPGANNGGLTLWIDNVQQADLTGVDNDTWRVNQCPAGSTIFDRQWHARHLLLRCLRVAAPDLYRTMTC